MDDCLLSNTFKSAGVTLLIQCLQEVSLSLFAFQYCYSVALQVIELKKGVDASTYQLTLINPQRGDTLREFFIWPVFKATPKTCATKTENPEARPMAGSRRVSGRAAVVKHPQLIHRDLWRSYRK